MATNTGRAAECNIRSKCDIWDAIVTDTPASQRHPAKLFTYCGCYSSIHIGRKYYDLQTSMLGIKDFPIFRHITNNEVINLSCRCHN